MNYGKIFSLLFLGILLVGGCKKKDDTPDYVESGKITEGLIVDNRLRQFVVYVPENVSVAESLPVVMAFHETGNTGDGFLTTSGWKEKADAEHFIAVFPTAWKYSCFAENGSFKTNTTKWNDDNVGLCPGAPDTLSNDVIFVRNIIDYMVGQYPIDVNRIYAAGFGSGANFCAKLSMDLSSRFAAVAASAGSLQDSTRTPSVVVPFIQTYGQNDAVSVVGGPLPLTLDVLSHPFIAPIVNRMLNKMKLDPTVYTFTQTAPTSVAVYNKSTAGQTNEYQFVVVKDLAYQYADGKNNALSYTSLIWDFFKRFKR